jgi:galactokinase
VGTGTTIDASLRLMPEGSLGMLDGEVQVPRGKWWTYALGVIAQFQAKVGVHAFDVAFASSVPLGGGLSSSAALEVSLATLLAEFTQIDLSARDRARWCQKADHQFVGVPCGIMDQYVSSAAVAGHALLIDCATDLARSVPMPPADQAVVVVIDSGVKHGHAGGEYGERARVCREGWPQVGLESLGELESGMDGVILERIARLADPASRYLRHAVTEQVRTLEAAQALRKGDIAQLGVLMNQSHESLAKDYRVSCPELDAIVEVCRGVPGCFGSRMTGGGFGGCAIALATPAAAIEIMTNVGERIRTPQGEKPAMFTTTAVGGTRLERL